MATVVFADLVGSTALGGSQDPERTRALLDRFYDAMANEIALAGELLHRPAGERSWLRSAHRPHRRITVSERSTPRSPCNVG